MSVLDQFITLSAKQVSELEQMFHKGTHKARSLKRAQVLLSLHQGEKPAVMATKIGVSVATVYNIANRYKQAGKPEEVLKEKPRPGQPSKFDKATQGQLTALACSQAPEGYRRWTLRLLADKLVELRIMNAISHKAVGKQLKKTYSSPGSKNNGALVK